MSRMSRDDRRQIIINAAADVFSQKGYYHTSIKDIASAADMSPALLYAYFESKEDLYEAVLHVNPETSVQTNTNAIMSEVFRRGACSETLMLFVYDMLRNNFTINEEKVEQRHIFDRLFLRSLLRNPDFAKQHHEALEKELTNSFITACFEAAEKSGDLMHIDTQYTNRVQFLLQIMLSFKVVFQYDTPLYDYGLDILDLVDHACRFCLRGIGFKETAIKKLYNPKELEEIYIKCHASEGLND